MVNNTKTNKEKRDRYNARRRELYALNPKKYIERSNNYYKNNKEKALESQRKRWEEVKEEVNKERKTRYQTDKEYSESIKQKANDYYEEHREEVIEKNNIYSKKNRTKINKKQRQLYRRYKNSLFEILGGYKCIKCGYDKDIRALQIDHINGGGRKDRGTNDILVMYRKYLRDPKLAKKELQILCANCNIVKSKTNENEFASNSRIYTGFKLSIKRREQIRISVKKYRKELKDRLFEILGGKRCINCGYDNELGLQFDHIKGGGRKEKKKLKESWTKYKFYVSNPDLAKETLQVLCSCCNQIKKFDNMEF